MITTEDLIMITVTFYNSARKNAKELKRFQFLFKEYNILNYLYPVLSYLVQFKPKYYTINLFKEYKSMYNDYTFRFSSNGYRKYIKIYDIESFINTLISYAFEEMTAATLELSSAHSNTIVRQLINKFYHNV